VSLLGITRPLQQTHLTVGPVSLAAAATVTQRAPFDVQNTPISASQANPSGAAVASPSGNVAAAESAVITFQQFKQALSTGDAVIIPAGSFSSFSNDLTTLLQAVQRGDQAGAAKAAIEVERDLKTISLQHHKRGAGTHSAMESSQDDEDSSKISETQQSGAATGSSTTTVAQSNATKTSTTALVQAAYDAVANFGRSSSDG
jgi:hypothetical protein